MLSYQYLGKTHNYWHGAVLILEDRATAEGELTFESREPPPYDGNYSEEILDPLKHVRREKDEYNTHVLYTGFHTGGRNLGFLIHL